MAHGSDHRPPREGSIKTGILKRLRAIPGCVVRARQQPCTTGDPDIYGCYLGRHFEIEVKQPGKNPTALQEHRIKEWQKGRAVTMVVWNVEQATALVHAIEALV